MTARDRAARVSVRTIDPVKVKKDLAAAAKGKPTAAKPAAKQQPRKTPTKKGTTK